MAPEQQEKNNGSFNISPFGAIITAGAVVGAALAYGGAGLVKNEIEARSTPDSETVVSQPSEGSDSSNDDDSLQDPQNGSDQGSGADDGAGSATGAPSADPSDSSLPSEPSNGSSTGSGSEDSSKDSDGQKDSGSAQTPDRGSDQDEAPFRSDDRIYTIVSGDTLVGISAKFGISVDSLADYNDIRNVDLIYTGSVLRIPAIAQIG